MMGRDRIESAYSQTIEKVLEVIGHSTAAHVNILGEKAIDIAVQNVEEYLKLLKNLRDDFKGPSSSHQSCMSPLLNDSMLVHRNRLSRSSKSRLNNLRNSPEGNDSPMEVDRNSLTPSRIGSIAEESTFLDETREMDESTNERGFLADVSDMNGTVRSRMPSFNFDQISPVACNRSRRSIQIMPINLSIDFDADTSSVTNNSRISLNRVCAGFDSESTILVNDDDMKTPQPRRTSIILLDSELTPTNNLWNVKLRPGSNRKISEEIRREIQRQLENDNITTNKTVHSSCINYSTRTIRK